jgi:hypothetical protein
MSGRLYTVAFSQILVANAQDLIAVYAGNMPFALERVFFNQTTYTATAGLPIAVKYLGPSVAPGSGGSALTPQKWVNGDAAATVTAAANNTTPATTTGTDTVLFPDVINLTYPYFWTPSSQKDEPTFGPNSALVVSLTANLTSPQNILLTGGVVIRELV